MDELSAVPDPAWPVLFGRITGASVPVKLHQGTLAGRRNTLYRLQVTTRSTLGALAFNSGGLEVDHGWVKVLGGGTTGLPDLAAINRLASPTAESLPPPYLVVAFDVLGGVFAIDGGGLGFTLGDVCYWAPDSLSWDSTGVGHTEFVNALLAGGFSTFYTDLRWSGWEEEVAALPTGTGLWVYPPLSSEEGRDISRSSRKPVPMTELLATY
ncbi:DUF2625 family protein [Microlunatus spumicola]|uniref:DUF2625 family protein n=1 Tax=Microlunatus spumicola TaxID=81499 RepID=UPI00195CE8DB